MRELDFDIFAGQDAGRALYRSAFLFASFLGFREMGSQMSPKIKQVVGFVESRMWQSNQCVLKLTPKFRYGLTAILFSFIPFGTRLLMQKYGLSDWNKTAGALDGGILCALTLTLQPSFILGSSAIGFTYGLLFEKSLRVFS